MGPGLSVPIVQQDIVHIRVDTTASDNPRQPLYLLRKWHARNVI